MSELRRKLTVEFIGTFFLVFTVGWRAPGREHSPRWRSAPSLMVMVFAGGHVFGRALQPRRQHSCSSVRGAARPAITGPMSSHSSARRIVARLVVAPNDSCC